jgi:hypothetical protein
MLSDSVVREVYLLVDAMDECSEETRSEFLEPLSNFMRPLDGDKGPRIRVLITSRLNPEILQALRWSNLFLEVDSHKINADLLRFIDDRVESLGEDFAPELRDFMQDPIRRLKQKVRETLLENAGGTFLWVSLVIQDIKSVLFKPKLVEPKLKKLPKTLYEAYDSLLNNIATDRFKDAKIILYLVVAARRPLTIEELATAKVLHTWEKDTLPPKEEIMKAANHFNYCKSLLYIDSHFQTKKKATVNLVHQSVKDYLLRDISKHASSSLSTPPSTSNIFRKGISLAQNIFIWRLLTVISNLVRSFGKYLSSPLRYILIFTHCLKYLGTTGGLIHGSKGRYSVWYLPQRDNSFREIRITPEADLIMFKMCWKYLSAAEFDHGHIIDHPENSIVEEITDGKNSETKADMKDEDLEEEIDAENQDSQAGFN